MATESGLLLLIKNVIAELKQINIVKCPVCDLNRDSENCICEPYIAKKVSLEIKIVALIQSLKHLKNFTLDYVDKNKVFDDDERAIFQSYYNITKMLKNDFNEKINDLLKNIGVIKDDYTELGDRLQVFQRQGSIPKEQVYLDGVMIAEGTFNQYTKKLQFSQMQPDMY